MAKLREKGIENLADVKLACMESDGEISVIEENPQPKQQRTRSLPGPAWRTDCAPDAHLGAP